MSALPFEPRLYFFLPLVLPSPSAITFAKSPARPAPDGPLPSPPQLEAVFLSLINYSTVIGRKQFAKYYYALLDVAPPSPGAPTCSFKRRAAATLGYGP